jgi:stearoyl-CoA desaturase (delta-9 desaturase)
MSIPGAMGTLIAPFYVWRYGISAVDIGLFLGMYWLTMSVGLCAGYHRHFTHWAFTAPKALRWFMAVCGSMAAQGSLSYWVAIHRRHHAFEDMEGDPHSPNLHGESSSERRRGLWHGHFGWTLSYGLPNATHYCPDILREPFLMSISRNYKRWVLIGLLVPALIGGILSASWPGAFSGVLWGGLVRSCVVSNSIWSLNSFCHRFGSRLYPTDDQSTINAWLALPMLRESWHNNHHAFPSSARHGLGRWQFDATYVLIWTLEKVGIASKVNGPKL